MWEWIKRNKTCELVSPVEGHSISVEQVSDIVFSSKMIGDGIAFQFDGDTIYAPCKAEVIMIANTKHAIGLLAPNGTQILIHIGLDTVNLKGEGFDVLVKLHSKVKKNDPLIRIDRKLMNERDLDLTTPMIITNGNEYLLEINNVGIVNTNSVVIKSTRK